VQLHDASSPELPALVIWLAEAACCVAARPAAIHRRIAAEPVSVVDILISGNAGKSQWRPAPSPKRKSRPKAASGWLDRLNPARAA
jgi:hypothetical protein